MYTPCSVIDFSLHGNWVNRDVLGTAKELIDMSEVLVSTYAELPKPNAQTSSLTASGGRGIAAAMETSMAVGMFDLQII